ncbi:MAG TPA: hypothetical protein VMX17_10505 [Candidatus Glassbacteria bacterium]|nr:hypothetical protein [Candidatus Glassbacteria bacterium]
MKEIKEKIEEEIWHQILEKKPDFHEPCEYQFTIICRGWFQPESTGEVRFVTDERFKPESYLTAWKHCDELESFDDGKRAIIEFRSSRQKLMEQ